MPMRWEAQRIGDDVADDDAIPGLDVVSRIPGLVRSVTTAEFAGITFHEVLAKSVLNAVPAASAMPFRFTVNAFRGCSHACAYCYARGSHTWLDLGPGDDFDRQVVVKTNAAQVLDRELGRPAWDRQHVALGTNTDPYQRAEGRYTLMPGIIDALVRHRTPLSILTKGTLLRRDLPQLSEAAGTVPVGIGVSIAVLDEQVRASLEPGTPSVRARLELVRAVRDAGLPCGVFMAPVLPGITDGLAALDDALARVAEAGATGVTVLPLHLRPGAREVYLGWLARERPDLVERYRRMYARGAYVSLEYRRWLRRRVDPLLVRHGFTRERAGGLRGIPGDDEGAFPPGSLPSGRWPAGGRPAGVPAGAGRAARGRHDDDVQPALPVA